MDSRGISQGGDGGDDCRGGQGILKGNFAVGATIMKTCAKHFLCEKQRMSRNSRLILATAINDPVTPAPHTRPEDVVNPLPAATDAGISLCLHLTEIRNIHFPPCTTRKLPNISSIPVLFLPESETYSHSHARTVLWCTNPI